MWFFNSKKSRVNRRRSNNRKTRRSFIKGGTVTEVPGKIRALFVTETQETEINLYIKNLNPSPKKGALASRSRTAASILSKQGSVLKNTAEIELKDWLNKLYKRINTLDEFSETHPKISVTQGLETWGTYGVVDKAVTDEVDYERRKIRHLITRIKSNVGSPSRE